MKGWPSTSTFTWTRRKATFRRMNLSTYCRRKWRHQIRRKERKRKQLQFWEILALICKVLISKVNSYYFDNIFFVYFDCILIVAPHNVLLVKFFYEVQSAGHFFWPPSMVYISYDQFTQLPNWTGLIKSCYQSDTFLLGKYRLTSLNLSWTNPRESRTRPPSCTTSRQLTIFTK